MTRRFTDGKFTNAAARNARTGPHGPTSGQLKVEETFSQGDTVKLKNGKKATVEKKTEWGDYVLKEFPGSFFPPSTLTLVKRKGA